jgi:hypothetical protein
MLIAEAGNSGRLVLIHSANTQDCDAVDAAIPATDATEDILFHS